MIGYEIRLSGNHPCEDICDRLAGVYPKSFRFTGWYPFCRCAAIPKLADKEDFIARQRAKLKGEEVPTGYGNEVAEMPESFDEWVEENKERIENAKTEPYFIRDNWEVVTRIAGDGKTYEENRTETMSSEAHIGSVPRQVDKIADIIIQNGGHASKDAQMAPLNIGLVPQAIVDYAKRNKIALFSDEIYITTKGIEHASRESKVAKVIAVSKDELLDFVKNRDSYAIYYDPGMGDFIFATAKAKFIIRPNYKLKISKVKIAVFNYITATRINTTPQNAFRYFIKIKDAKQ
ncbi:MAG: hypothetical protein K2H99_02050 [Paramuribaculum sp.]|nr:hypothetical protein [Paramuribaculum sp.]